MYGVHILTRCEDELDFSWNSLCTLPGREDWRKELECTSHLGCGFWYYTLKSFSCVQYTSKKNRLDWCGSYKWILRYPVWAAKPTWQGNLLCATRLHVWILSITWWISIHIPGPDWDSRYRNRLLAIKALNDYKHSTLSIRDFSWCCCCTIRGMPADHVWLAI